jgi:hypothetical protein
MCLDLITPLSVVLQAGARLQSGARLPAGRLRSERLDWPARTAKVERACFNVNELICGLEEKVDFNTIQEDVVIDDVTCQETSSLSADRSEDPRSRSAGPSP